MMLSDKYLPFAVGLIFTAVISLLSPWVAKRLHVTAESVVKVGGLLVGIAIMLLILVDLSSLPKPQPWVTPVMLCLGVFLWAIVVWRLQLRISHADNNVGDAVSGLRGPPNYTVLNGQSVLTPFKYPTISALSNAIEGAEQGIKALANWDVWRLEDSDLALPNISIPDLTPIDEHTIKVVLDLHFSIDKPITIANLAFGWRASNRVVWLPMFGGEREVSGFQQFEQFFELAREFPKPTSFPSPWLIGYAITRHHIVWKCWSGQVG